MMDVYSIAIITDQLGSSYGLTRHGAIDRIFTSYDYHTQFISGRSMMQAGASFVAPILALSNKSCCNSRSVYGWRFLYLVSIDLLRNPTYHNEPIALMYWSRSNVSIRSMLNSITAHWGPNKMVDILQMFDDTFEWYFKVVGAVTRTKDPLISIDIKWSLVRITALLSQWRQAISWTKRWPSLLMYISVTPFQYKDGLSGYGVSIIR